MINKQCPKCKKIKEQKDFNRSASRVDKMAVYCRECENESRRQKNIDKKNEGLYGIF